jgi:hypothetical protein
MQSMPAVRRIYLAGCDLALLDGPQVDGGTAWEIGYVPQGDTRDRDQDGLPPGRGRAWGAR